MSGGCCLPGGKITEVRAAPFGRTGLKGRCWGEHPALPAQRRRFTAARGRTGLKSRCWEHREPSAAGSRRRVAAPA